MKSSAQKRKEKAQQQLQSSCCKVQKADWTFCCFHHI